MKRTMKLSWALLLLLAVTLVSSCKKSDPEPAVIASFTYTVDASDFLKVNFVNESKNYESVTWDFGDGSFTSTEFEPSHTFAAIGEYTVKLTAKSPGGATDIYAEKITIADPNAELTKLVGEGTAGKTWKLLRDVNTGVYPLEVGPIDHSTIWWAVGKGNDELANRPCMFNDEFTFKRDGTLTYNANGDYWAEGGVFEPGNICASTADPMVGIAPGNEDLTPWGGGTHHFRLDAGIKKVTAIGKGAFIGFLKASTDCEVMKLTPMVQDSVTYDIVSLVDGNVDTLIVQVNYKFAPTDAAPGGYWRFVLVHYDNPADEPGLPGNKPNVGFTMALSGKTATFTNTSTGATSYLWDFGDGITSADQNPVHTYVNEGFYTVSLTATNSNGSNSMTTIAFVSATTCTDALLQGAPWHVKVDEMSVFVGPALGSNAWWHVTKAMLDGSSSGAEDWSCMPNDEFQFSAGGVFSYDTKGTARNDGYFGGTNGCIDDAAIAASGNGAAFGTCHTHSYTFTPAGKGRNGVKSRPIITLTNAPGYAAFLGFYKGYYGGENTDGSKAPNGGFATNVYEVMGYANTGSKEYLFVSVDLTPDHTGTSAWSAILER
jgi:PKD repeat protein